MGKYIKSFVVAILFRFLYLLVWKAGALPLDIKIHYFHPAVKLVLLHAISNYHLLCASVFSGEGRSIRFKSYGRHTVCECGVDFN